MHVGGEEGDRMAKSGGMLNAICAKLQKPTTDGTVMDDDGEMRYKDESICMMDTDTDKENNNQPQVDNQNCYTQDSQVDNDRGRKSRRKNLKPRNIAQLKEFRDEYSYDELEEYEVIGKDVEYDCIYERDNRNGCILDLSRNSNTEDSEEARADDGSLDGSSESYHVDNSGALDLTVDRGQGHGDPGQGQTPSTSHINYASDSNHDSNNDSENDELVTNGNGLYKGESFFTDEEDDDADNQNNQVNADDEDDDNDESAQNLANGDNKQESVMSSNEMTSSAVTPSEPPADAAAIKDYAQSTVNELLSMYGLSDDKESITESVPIQNFSSGKILQRHGVIPLPRQVPRLWPSVSPSPSMSSSSAPKMLPVSQAIPVPKVAPKPAHQGLVPLTTNATPMSTPSIYNLAHQSPQLPTPSPRPTHPNEGIYAKFVESVSKIASITPGQKNPAASKFAQSAEYIKACFNPDLAPKLAAAVSNTLPGKTSLPDYTKYMKRYVSSHECGREQCRNMAYREHFHCLDCQFKVFVKKEEMIRHFKWHKKRDESLQHGFMRYSPLDDCSKQFDACTHNGKQTHYHCIQTGCNKVYISTSDVQMHANYHRKDSAIIQEGFQRFRATEDCGTPTCSFYGQRTTHFHCRRNDCIFTFKNKADMEKHKTYHQKDEVLRRDGFKKFMKYEHCIHQGTCKYSKVANHIHCIRPGCDYVLHSTGQLYSHKRKHERQEFESAYRQFKDNHKGLKSSHTSPSSSSLDNHSGMSTPTLGNIGGSFVFTPRSSISPVNSSWKTTQSGISSVNLSPASAASVVSPITPSSQSVLSSTGGVMGNTSVSAPYSSTPKNYQMISPSAAAAAAVVAQMKQQTNSASPSFSSANDTLRTSQSTSEGIFSVLPSSSSALSLPAPSVSTIAPQLMLTQQPSVINIVPKRHEAEYIDLEDLSRMHRSRSTSPAAPATDLTSPPAALANAMVMTTPSQMVEVKSEQEESLSTKPLPSTLAKLASKLNGADLDDSLTLPIPPTDLDEKPFDGSHSTVDADEKDEMGGMGSKMHLSTPSAHGGIASDIRFVPKTSPAVNSKKEKDESWKKYLTRYTANDPCHPHCEFLYKDHYHCNKGCGMIFKSKDGVREHARYHMQQDCISPISYSAYDSNTACTDEMCVHRCKNHHYHCIWPECRVVITDKDPPFARLEHHKIHEYARAASAKIPHQFMHQYKLSPEGLKRRRGRPPKFPKDDVTIVPKVEMTDEEIATTLLHDHTGAHHTLRSGFKKFHIGQACPDDKCMYQMQEHYHCVRPRCHHSTDRPDVLNLHAKDFHSYIVILPGFEFFDRNVNCRRQHCHNRRVNKHFHCMQPRCDYSFVRYSTMAQHDKKHKFAQLATLGSQNMALALQPTGFKAMPQQTSRALAMMMSSAPAGITSTSHLTLQPEQSIHHLSNSSDIDSVVKTKGIYFPVSSAPGDHNGNLAANDTGLTSKMLSSDKSRVTSSGFGMSLPTTVSAAMDLTKFGQFDESEKVSDGYLAPTMATPIVITPTTPPPTSMSNAYNVNKSRMVNIAPKMSPGIATEATSSPEMPLTMLLQQKSQAVVPQLDWLTMKMKMHFGMHQNCGRPFCKLKKKDHFHCFDCNQAFSDSCRLKSHITRHGLKLDKSNYVHGVRLAAVTNGLNSNNTSAGQGMVESGDASPVNSDSDWSKDEVAEREDAGEFNPSSSLNLNAATFSNMLRGNQALSNNPATPTTAPEVMDLSVGIAYPAETGDAEYEESEPSEGCDDGEGSGEMVEEGVDEGGMIPDDATSQEEQMMPQIDSNSLNTPENDLNDDNNAIVDDVDRVSFSRHSGRKRVATRHDDFVDSDVVVAKQRRTSSPRPANDENVPEGYEKFAFVDDCRAERCAYRLNASHYHCIRPDCRFSFSDRTRAPQHTQRHERVDSVMGDEFQQHRIHLDCEKAGCEFSRKATHFHCLRCEFACTDLAKVPLHRKQHSKMDAVDAFGFEKVSSSEECHHKGCAYSNRQTHYHCTQNACAQIMLTPAQMRPHQLTHESG